MSGCSMGWYVAGDAQVFAPTNAPVHLLRKPSWGEAYLAPATPRWGLILGKISAALCSAKLRAMCPKTRMSIWDKCSRYEILFFDPVGVEF